MPRIREDNKQVISINGKRISYFVRVSLRAKRARLEIAKGKGLLVVIPKGFRLAEVPKLVETKSSWILRKLALIESVAGLHGGQRALKEGDVVPYWSGALTLQIRAQSRPGVQVEQDGGALRIVTPSSDSAVLNNALRKWYLCKAREIIPQRVTTWAQTLHCSFNRVYIRNQRARWGSCASRKNLSLNWRLILMPQKIMDYVVVHELTHLEVPNHSRAFWKVVEERYPEYLECRTWLRENGHRLLLW